MYIVKCAYIEKKSGRIYEYNDFQYSEICESGFNLAIDKNREHQETEGSAIFMLCTMAKDNGICNKRMSDESIMEYLKNSNDIKNAWFEATCIGPLSDYRAGRIACYYNYNAKENKMRRYIRALNTCDDQRWEESDEDLTKQKIYPVGSIVFTRDNLYWLVKYDSWHDRMVLRASNIFSNMYLCKGIGKDNDYMAQIHFEDIIACVDINGNPLGAVIPESIHDKRIYEYEICYRARY